MSRSTAVIVTTGIFLLFLALFGGMVWGNTFYSQEHPGETDFMVPWLAARSFLEFGDSPYSEAATQRAQIAHYGRLATQSEDPLNLWVPLPLELFYFPFSLLQNYDIARGLWMTFTEISLIFAGFICLRLTGWKPSRFLLPVVLLFPILWVFGLMDFLSASCMPMVFLALISALQFLRTGQDEIAGVLLVFPLLKLDMLGMIVLFLLWWVISHRRWRVLLGLGMGLGILLLLSFLLLPDWIVPFGRNLLNHVQINPGISSHRVLSSIWPVFGRRFGWLITAILSVLLFFEWRDVRRQNFSHVIWTVCLTLAATPLLGFPVNQNGLSVLSLPFLLIISTFVKRWPGRRQCGLAGLILMAAFLIPWGMATAPNLHLELLLPVLLLISLYWIRWWAVHPSSTVF